MQIKVVPLGAGQDVGKSCILVTMGGKNILLDSGMHPGYNDERRFPDFRYISREGNFNGLIDLVIISHFHLDHCGSLPYFTEMCGYSGPIYATHPTKAIMPILLEDYRKISVERRGIDEKDFFTSQMIKDCMLKITPCALEETIVIEPDFEIRAYYAGHVLGAAMFYVRVGQQSFVYTGDYNMTPDRHLGSANCDRLRPDLLITESTYATTIRDSKRCRERDLLRQVSECVREGGKVLIPVFALGRAQELCLLLDAFWERTGLDVPIYFSAGLTERANWYYKMFIGWTNQKIKNTFVKRNVFDFVHIRPFDRALVDTPGPMVLFATPGMLHGGLSSDVFKRWAPNANNLVIMPGYCVAGTLGHKVLSNGGKPQVIDLDRSDGGGKLHVRCKIKHMSFSAHADAKGIMTLIKRVEPKAVMLVHGERQKMEFLKERIRTELNLPCYNPANGSTCYINTPHAVPVLLSSSVLAKRDRGGGLVDEEDELGRAFGGGGGGMFTKRQLAPTSSWGLEGVLSMPDAKSVRLLQDDAAAQVLRVPKCDVVFKHSVPLPGADGPEGPVALAFVLDGLHAKLEKDLGVAVARTEPPPEEEAGGEGCPLFLFALAASSMVLTVSDGSLSFEWGHHEEHLAHRAWATISASLALPPALLPPKASDTATQAASPGYNPPQSPTYGPDSAQQDPLQPTSPSEAPPPTPAAKKARVKREKD